LPTFRSAWLKALPVDQVLQIPRPELDVDCHVQRIGHLDEGLEREVLLAIQELGDEGTRRAEPLGKFGSPNPSGHHTLHNLLINVEQEQLSLKLRVILILLEPALKPISRLHD